MPLEVAVLRPDLALHSGPLGRLAAMLRDQARLIDDLGNLRRCDHQKYVTIKNGTNMGILPQKP